MQEPIFFAPFVMIVQQPGRGYTFSVNKKGKLSQVTYGKVHPEGFGTPGIPVPGAAIVPSGG